MSLQRFLSRLIWLSILPLLLLLIVCMANHIARLQSQQDRDAHTQATHLANAIDQRLGAHIDALRMLALSPHAEQPTQHALFYRETQAFQQSFDSHVFLITPNRQVLFNTRWPLGTVLPALTEHAGHNASVIAATTGKPAVSDVFTGALSQVTMVGIAVPGVRKDKTAFILGTTLEVQRINHLLDTVNLPQGWVLRLIDSQGTLIAYRNPAGLPLDSSIQDSLRFIAHPTLAPWSVVIDIPHVVYFTTLIKTWGLLGVAIVATTLIAFMSARRASQRLTQSIERLNDAPNSVTPSIGISELASVHHQLSLLGASLEAAGAELKIREASLLEAQRIAALGDWHWDLQNDRHTRSAETYRIMGRNLQSPDVPFSALHTLFQPASWAQLAIHFQTSKTTGTAFSCDAEVVRTDGAPCWITIRGEAVRNAAGTVVALQGSIQDITERKLTEQALIEHRETLSKTVQERTQALSDSLADSVLARQQLQAKAQEHERTEERLRLAERTLNQAARIAKLGAWSIELKSLIDFGNNPVMWSPEMYHLFDYRPEDIEVLNHNAFINRVHPDDRQKLMATTLNAMTEQRLWETEFRLILSDGSERLVLETGDFIFDDAGKAVSMHGALKDITTQRRNENELAQYRDHLEERVNQRTIDLSAAEAEHKRLNRSLRLLSDCNMALVRAKDEQHLLDELCALVVHSGGYLMAWVGVAEHNEAKSVRAVAKAGKASSYLQNIQISWDAEKETGHGPIGLAIRSGTTQVVQNCWTNPLIALWRKSMLEQGYQSSVTIPIVVNAQAFGFMKIYSAEPGTFGPADVALLEEMVRDVAFGMTALRARNDLQIYQHELEARVTDRTQEIVGLNAALQIKAGDAEAANKAKSTFLSAMSHELRTPLNAVMGLTGLLADSPLNRRQKDYADKIQLSAKALRALIDDILDFSKIEADALVLEHAPFSLHEILSTTAAVIGVGLRGKSIEALFDIAPDIPDALIGDALRLQQILLNLSGNAVKFTNKGVIVISVACTARDSSQVTLRFTVRDTGIGIAPEQLGPIFDGFTQADSATSRTYGGTGLGLAISSRLAQLMGSQIDVNSALGWGSEFHLTITLGLGHGDQSPAHGKSVFDLRILIIDDHPLVCDILTKTCTSFGWKTTTVDSGAAGLEELRRSAHAHDEYDLVLLDWRMPEMDGLEMLRQAYACNDIGLPLVVLMAAAFELEQAVAAFDDTHLDGIVAKPLTPTSLFEAIIRAYTGDNTLQLPVTNKPSQRLAGMHLLVAEDNDLNQEVVEQILTRAGASVVLAANGLLAVEILRQPHARFDAVLMDIQMPVMDGYTATKIIRETLGLVNLPIIAVTAFARPEDREKSRLAGMMGHIVKPLDVQDLLDLLARYQVINHLPPKVKALALAQAPQVAGLNVAAALQTFGGDQQKYITLLLRFLRQHSDASTQIRHLFNTHDISGAAKIAHDLRGIAPMLQANDLEQLAGALEDALRDGYLEMIAFLLDDLEQALGILATSVAQLDALWGKIRA